MAACVDFFSLFCVTLVLCEQALKGEKKLSTGAGIYSHVGVDFEHHVLVLIEEEDAEGRHLLWDAARLRDAWDNTHCPHYALDGGMVRGLQSLKQRDTKDYSTAARISFVSRKEDTTRILLCKNQHQSHKSNSFPLILFSNAL